MDGLDLDLDLNPAAELERLIIDCTCEWCGQTHWVNTASTVSSGRITDVVRGWFCRKQRRNGYVSRHWRMWRVCNACRRVGVGLGTFDRWVFPVITNMDYSILVDQIIDIQPMQLPAAQIMYMDLVVGPAGAQHVRRYAEAEVNKDFYGVVDLAATEERAEPRAIPMRHYVTTDAAQFVMLKNREE
jgi:hypothetical protein